jgi:hypothetical protein
MVPPGPPLDEAKAVVDAAAIEAGRDPTALGMEGRASWGPGGLDTLLAEVGQWSQAGATHLSINTMGAGLVSVDDHLAALAAAAGGLGLTQR